MKPFPPEKAQASLSELSWKRLEIAYFFVYCNQIKITDKNIILAFNGYCKLSGTHLYEKLYNIKKLMEPFKSLTEIQGT